MESVSVAARPEGKTTEEHEEAIEGDGLFTSLTSVVSWVFTYVKICQRAHFKCVQFTVCQFYLHKLVYLKIKERQRERERQKEIQKDKSKRKKCLRLRGDGAHVACFAPLHHASLLGR